METVKWNCFLTAPYHTVYIKAYYHSLFIFLQFCDLKYCLQNDRDNLHFCCNCYEYLGTTDLRLRDSTVILAGRRKHLHMYFCFKYSNKCKRFKPISTCVPLHYLCPPRIHSTSWTSRVHSTTCAQGTQCHLCRQGSQYHLCLQVHCTTCALGTLCYLHPRVLCTTYTQDILQHLCSQVDCAISAPDTSCCLCL